MDQDMEDDVKRVEWLHSEQYSVAGDVFGEPKKKTRVGDKYQAQIPSLMTENERLHLVTSSGEESGLVGSGTDNGLHLVTSSGEESWSVIERESFLLGLYIFGKNLRAVNKFMLNKGLQNVMSYYYGKFYRSTQHQQWSIYRKKNNRKSVPGNKIFKGWRRQELLFRLLPDVTDECKSHLTQISSMFDKGEIIFENYVHRLRDTVGMDLLVEAVAIGNEKQDLTTKVKKRVRSKKTDTACSSLTTEKIVSLLKDRIGLCKTRLNELFWEAVWPRLLKRGWHSEQAKNYALQSSKQSLVFLAPGVSKFSRRSLVKGIQYFESFDEVLDKVALEPQLLEQIPDQDTIAEPQAKQDSDDEQDVMKYITVDTSFVGLVKFKEMTSLPDCETKVPTNGQPKAKRHRGDKNIKTKQTTGEDEPKDEETSEKKRPRIEIGLNSPPVANELDGDTSLCSTELSVFPEATNNHSQQLAAKVVESRC